MMAGSGLTVPLWGRPCDPSRLHPLTSKGRFLFPPDFRVVPHRLCSLSSIYPRPQFVVSELYYPPSRLSLLIFLFAHGHTADHIVPTSDHIDSTPGSNSRFSRPLFLQKNNNREFKRS